ncbi:MAG: D-alanine--D-alanine ligase family protein [Mycobacteriales bacterium]
MTRIRVAVVFGGRSTEHAISCVSAASVLAALDPTRYDVVAVGITEQGRWVLGPTDPSALAIQGGVLPAVLDGRAVAVPGDPTAGGLVALDGQGVLPGVDVVFPVLHGPYGEDGTIQGLLELAGIPYVGSGVLASAASMDKAVARVLLEAAGLTVTPAVVVRAADWAADRDRVTAQAQGLGLPVFVKPARGGSSIGISKVADWSELEAAMEAALARDPKVLIEAAVAGREVECGILEGPDGTPLASVPAEIRLVGDYDFYDFEAKYLDAATELDCPADLPVPVTEALQEQAKRAFVAMDCSGLARVDFFVADDGSLTINEINTMPGFTPSSMFPLMWAAQGVDYPELVNRLIATALRRGTGLR